MTDSGNLWAVSEQWVVDQYESRLHDPVPGLGGIGPPGIQAASPGQTIFSSINTVLLMATGFVPSNADGSVAGSEINWQVALTVAVA